MVEKRKQRRKPVIRALLALQRETSVEPKGFLVAGFLRICPFLRIIPKTQATHMIHIETRKGVLIILFGITIVFILTGILYWSNVQKGIAYERNVECSRLVSNFETQTRTQTIQMLGSSSGLTFAPSRAHFNKKMNTCLGSFTTTLFQVSSDDTGIMTEQKQIIDVVDNNIILNSVLETRTSGGVSTNSVFDGLGKEEFKAQEVILMAN